jgi:hypothetical protein
MFHNVETIIDDLENSILEPTILADDGTVHALMEKHARKMQEIARPKWEADEMFDIDKALQGAVGEVVPVDFSKLTKGPIMSMEVSQAEINKIASDALRRMAGGNDDDFRKTDDVEPDEEDENEEIPADEAVKADIAFLKSKQAEGVDLYEYTNGMLHTDLPRARELKKAIAHMGVV